MSESVYKKLMECGQKKLKSLDFNGLEEFVEELDFKQMMNLIAEKIFGVEAPQILNYLMMGFSQKASSHKKRLKLCQGVLNEIQSREIPSRNIVALTSRIALEIEKFSTSHLVSIADQCVELIRTSNSPSQTSWKELLPKVLAVVVEKKEIDFAGAEMSGIEFRHRIIQTVCGIQWHAKIVTSLAAMFIEMQLSAEEHLQVVNKLCSHLDDLPPQEIPPLVHQMLQLCRDQHGVTVFLALRRYFAANIYKNNTNKCADDSTEQNTDSIENVDSKELIECESMVLYHIEESAKLSRGCVSDLLKLAKTSTNCPEIILDTFLLAVLLSLSSISAYEVQVIEVVKSAIWRSVIEEERKQESAWLSQMVNTQCNIENVLTQLIMSKVCERDKVLKGLVTLNLTLLGTTTAKGKEHVAELLWKFGRHALMLLVKRQRQVAHTVLQNLTDRIITGQNVIQYTDCLNRICNSATLIVLENLPVMNRLLDFLNQLPGPIAKGVITAALSIVRISNKLRDNLILVLRKALFSREVETRKIAVSGFLQLLKCLRIKGLAALSQSQNSYSGPSVFTQICLDIHTQQPVASNSSSNEAICLEVLGVLRRCFMQQASVKVCLYEGLYDALCRNPELCPSVLDILLDHFNQFYEPDVATLPPLNIAKAIKIHGIDAVLQEPIGKLMFAIQQIVVKASEELGDAEQPRSLEKFTDILTSLVNRLIKCDISHFELDDATNLLDIVPESLQKQAMIVQILSVYEAMMAYIVNSWSASSTQQQGQQLLSLYKGYNIVVEFVKNCKTSKKEGDGGTKKNAKKDKDKIQGKKPPAFKLPETILDFNSIHRMLSLLLSDDLVWASEEARADIKGRRVIHRYAFQAAVEVIQQSKTQMSQWKSSAFLKPCTQFASLLYNQCLLKFSDLSSFDMSAAVLGVECFTEIVALLVTHFKSNLSEIISEIARVPKENGLGSQLKPLIKVYLKLLEETVQNEEEEEEEDVSIKKLLQILITGLSMLAQQLPTDSQHTLKTLDWMTNFAQNRSLPVVLHAKNLMTLLFTLITRCKPESSLFDNLAVQLCHLFGTVNEADVEECPITLKIVNEATKTTVLQLLCANLINSLDQVNWLIVRLRAENAVLVHPTATKSSPQSRRAACRRREKELVQQLGHCINAAQSICCIAVPPGPCTEAVFKLLSHTYNTLTSLTKYFSSISTPHDHVYQDSRFGKAVKLAGSHLSDQISELVLYVEDVSVEKDKRGSLVLNHARKQMIYIPRLVADLENFSKAITLLSNKCKDKSLSTNVKLTTMRDFRLHTKTLELIMNRNNQSGSEEDEDEAAEVSQQRQTSQQKETSQENRSARKRSIKEDATESTKKRKKIDDN